MQDWDRAGSGLPQTIGAEQYALCSAIQDKLSAWLLCARRNNLTRLEAVKAQFFCVGFDVRVLSQAAITEPATARQEQLLLSMKKINPIDNNVRTLRTGRRDCAAGGSRSRGEPDIDQSSEA